MHDVRINDTFLQKCTPSCNITQYVKTYEWIGNWNPVQSEVSQDIWFYYSLSKNETIVFEEYLIYDFVSIIGSIGGTLGLFIGFSLSKLVSIILYQIQKYIFHVIAKFME